jgi:hypothetical protein
MLRTSVRKRQLTDKAKSEEADKKKGKWINILRLFVSDVLNLIYSGKSKPNII